MYVLVVYKTPVLHSALFTAAGGAAWMEPVPQGGGLTWLSLTKSPANLRVHAHTHTEYIVSYRLWSCTHILSQAYLLLLLYGSNIGKKQIYLEGHLVFLEVFIMRRRQTGPHMCVLLVAGCGWCPGAVGPGEVPVSLWVFTEQLVEGYLNLELGWKVTV